MNRKELMEAFNRRPRIGSLATADSKGDVNAAVFGSPQMLDENTVVMGIGRNRSLANLEDNPKAVFIFMEPAQSALEWKGARVYLDVESIEKEGPLFDRIKAQIRKVAGDRSADAMHAALRFKIREIRPLIAPP
jgi:hypothetical protein